MNIITKTDSDTYIVEVTQEELDWFGAGTTTSEEAERQARRFLQEVDDYLSLKKLNSKMIANIRYTSTLYLFDSRPPIDTNGKRGKASWQISSNKLTHINPDGGELKFNKWLSWFREQSADFQLIIARGFCGADYEGKARRKVFVEAMNNQA